MSVCRGDHIGARGVHLRVDGEGRLIHRHVTVNDGTVVAHQQQIADPDVPEVHPERVHPEVIGELGIAGGDVPGHTLVETEPAEQPERRGKILLAVQALLLEAALLRDQ